MEQLYDTKSFIEIPTIDDKRLEELYHLLKPIVSINQIKYFLKEYTLAELRYKSYIWNKNRGNIVFLNKLEVVDDFLCLHKWGNNGLFQPTIADVLAQVPENLIGVANAFEIIDYKRNSEDVFNYGILDNGFHLSRVRTYKIHK